MLDASWLIADVGPAPGTAPGGLGGSFAELHCLGSGIQFELLRSWFFRIAFPARPPARPPDGKYMEPE